MTTEKHDKPITTVGDLEPHPASVDSPRMAMYGGKDMVHESFHPMPNATVKFFKENEVPEIKGVVLKGSKRDIYGDKDDGFKEIPESEFAEDETYALPADKGVVSLPYLAADHDGNVAWSRPRQLKRSKNHQRQGYSKRKAKRRASWNGLFKARFKERAGRLMGWLDSCSELTLKSDIHIGQAMGRADTTKGE